MRIQVSGVGHDLFIISDDNFMLQFYSKPSDLKNNTPLLYQERIDPYETLAVCITHD